MLSASKASSTSFRRGSNRRRRTGGRRRRATRMMMMMMMTMTKMTTRRTMSTATVLRDLSLRKSARKRKTLAMQIDLDVDRTFPENDIFRTHGKEALRRILRAYSRRNPKTGYCQGMNYIAAFIWLAVRNSDSFNASSSSSNNSRSEAGATTKKTRKRLRKLPSGSSPPL